MTTEELPFELCIRRVGNGFILKTKEIDYECDVVVTHENVFEMDHTKTEESLGELKAGLAMLWYVIEYFGLRKSKHDKYRMSADIEGLEE